MENIDKRKVLRQRSVDKEKQKAERKKLLADNLRKILKKELENRTREDKDFLEQHKTMAKKIKARITSREEKEDRKKEWEDDLDVLKSKCAKLAEAIRRSKRLVVYTGAGMSTSANIPDYRGPNGIWTLLDQGKEIAACDLGLAQPTTAHMALFMLYKQSKISHIVSQNCDGLHLRSGIPRCKISEVHGNMFIEVCKSCKPVRPFVRLFDVTERTNRHRHTTMRRCYICGNSLQDTIVHFGERGSVQWPINWTGASKAAEKADMILCLGSSLKVLRRYPWLWCMDRPVHKRPPLYIVNLQWTPKDSTATMKINGRCDFVMAEVVNHLRMKIPEYTPYNDPLLSYATHLHEKEEHTTSRRTLIESKPVGVTQLSMQADVSPNGVITEVRVRNTFTTAKTEFQHLSSERKADSTEDEGEEQEELESQEAPEKQEEQEDLTSNGEDIKEEPPEEKPLDSGESEAYQEGGSNGLDMEPPSNDPVKTESEIVAGDIASTEYNHSNGTEHHDEQQTNSSQSNSSDQKVVSKNIPGEDENDIAACVKKPKLESQDYCDNNGGFDPLGDKNVLHSLMSQIEDYVRPFPSPDHTYAISPAKDDTEVKSESADDNCDTPTYRKKRKSPKYTENEEDYFLMCQESLLNTLKRKHMKKLSSHVNYDEDEEDEDDEEIAEVKEIEYRTIKWPKDALYFSYEPNFLFNDDEDDEIEFVCDCCDPKRRKKKPSSEECSEEELSDKDASEEEEDEEEGGQSKLGDETCDSNDLLEEDSEDSRGFPSREDSPAVETTPLTTAKSSKPLPPGWFGKGRSKKRRK